MSDIMQIIKALDEKIGKIKKSYLTPPEANKFLERENLLNDSVIRPGLPLRNLLRQGKIPHAYQIGGKGSKWKIPHSNPKNSTLLNHSPIKKREESREKYKPEKIKYLLIAEAPPENLERFFYYSDVGEKDCLFLGIMEALYPSEKQKYLMNRNPNLKEKLLL
ncbi:MAG: hypothetical protein WC900_08790, partial [Oscillospiraceae bacterium]